MDAGPRIRRRAVLAGVGAAFVPRQARATSAVPPIPLGIQIARVKAATGDEAPVVTDAWLDAQLSQANAIFGEHELRFVEAMARAPLDGAHARLETRAERDALAARMSEEVANVFVVESLRDVDDPKLFRMGVMWRNLKNLKKKYVIVAASALETTLAHELGHYLGNPHSFVKNNLMSYLREEGGKVFLDKKQGEVSRRTARGLFAAKELKEAARG
jgi:hypothetical protein